MQYDLLIKNVRVVRPNEHGVREADIAVKGEKFFAIENGLDVKEAKSVYDGKGPVIRLAPGQTEQVRVPLIFIEE